MSSGPNNGAFYIQASDITTTDSFRVPGEKAGLTPDGTENPSQPSFDVDHNQKMHSKTYYVFVKNELDVDLTFTLQGSHFDDKQMNEAVIEQPKETLRPGETCVLEDNTGHSYMETVINGLTSAPGSGQLKVIFQTRYR